MCTKVLIFILFTSFYSPNSFSEEFDFYCYSGQINYSGSEIVEIRFAWSKLYNWNSFIVFKNKDGKYFTEDAACPEFQKNGNCSIFDDGGHFRLTPISSHSKDFKKYGDLKVELNGKPFLQPTDSDGIFVPQIVSGRNYTFGMKRINKSQCKYKYD